MAPAADFWIVLEAARAEFVRLGQHFSNRQLGFGGFNEAARAEFVRRMKNVQIHRFCAGFNEAARAEFVRLKKGGKHEVQEKVSMRPRARSSCAEASGFDFKDGDSFNEAARAEFVRPGGR